jgi:hypothetical protein
MLPVLNVGVDLHQCTDAIYWSVIEAANAGGFDANRQ